MILRDQNTLGPAEFSTPYPAYHDIHDGSDAMMCKPTGLSPPFLTALSWRTVTISRANKHSISQSRRTIGYTSRTRSKKAQARLLHHSGIHIGSFYASRPQPYISLGALCLKADKAPVLGEAFDRTITIAPRLATCQGMEALVRTR